MNFPKFSKAAGICDECLQTKVVEHVNGFSVWCPHNSSGGLLTKGTEGEPIKTWTILISLEELIFV